MKIAAVVLTKNEEKNIQTCLNSLLWCDEIVIVDDYSQDKTIRKMQNHIAKVKIFKRRLNDNFGEQRNFGLSKALVSSDSRGTDWILFVDADEEVSDELSLEIRERIEETGFNGFYIRRRDFWMGKELGFAESGATNLLRLGRAGSGSWKRRVHEYWDIKGSVGQLKNFLSHRPHPTISSFIKKVCFYSELHAVANRKEKKSSSVFKIFFYPIFKFCQNFIFRRGFLDGTHGFVISIVLSFHSFLGWSNLWILQEKQKRS